MKLQQKFPLIPRYQIGVKRLSADAIMPTFAHPGEDLAADLYSTERVSIFPGKRHMIGTGIAIDFPVGMGAIITGRSGLMSKQGLTVITGTVDQGFRGEMKVMALNTSEIPVHIFIGDRIGQMRLVYLINAEFTEVEDLSDTTRGEKGWGSTGVNCS